MADYKELIRKAIQALPENNGAARRAVYEKARAALVGQLRGLNPPLAARDITQHRLQLEDCIRQVEQEASEAVIAGLKQSEDYAAGPAALPPPRPASARPTASATRPASAAAVAAPRSGGASGARSSSSPRSGAAAPAARPAAAGTAARPSARVATPPAVVPRLAAATPKPAASSVSRSAVAAARSNGRAAQPAIFPRAVLDRAAEPAPETIEDIIAAAESDLAEPEAPEEEPHVDVDEAPEPPMFRLEERPARRAAANGRAAAVEPRAVEPRAVEPKVESRPVPAIVARAEAVKAGKAAPRNGEAPRRANGGDGHRNGAAGRPQVAARQAPQQGDFEPIRLPRPAVGGPAMSSVREVELEEDPSEGDAQVAIERAIATLEREARNDGDDHNDDIGDEPPTRPQGRRRGNAPAERAPREREEDEEEAFARAPVETERGGGSAVTIFLLVFLVLLIVAGGASFWAWREGFIDFDAMFGKTSTTRAVATQTPAPSLPAPAAQTNTESAPNTAAQSSAPLSAAPATPVPSASAPAEPSAQTGAPKSEERLSQSSDAAPAAAPGDTAAPTPGATAAAAGNQSLLLEASQDGTTGAVPFSGTVDWSQGKDELGQPTIVGKANIPARNLGVSVLIRKNSDPTLPASHLMEINFSVTDSFIGGAISGLPGVLLKNEELVQGTPLVGASARVVGNSFLFALSSSPQDEATNKDLLTSRKWMDLAIIYATGKKAIITLEKDDKTQQMFNDVFAAWDKEAAAKPAAPAPAAPAAAPAAAGN
jgi:hypothetical protein